MFEIIILIKLGTKIAEQAREKGRSGGWFVVLLLALWFGGELFGAITAGIAGAVFLDEDKPVLVLCYLGALAGAIIGAVVAFMIVEHISPAYKPDEYDDYDYEDEYEDGHERHEQRDPYRDRY